MFRLGLTGGIATGKSTVSNYLKAQGIPVLDADVIAHQILEPGQPALADVVDTFGSDILMTDGQLNRSKLGAIVFNDSTALTQLNALTHPRVFEAFEQQLKTLAAKGVPLVVLDIPLLFENVQRMHYDAIAVVTTTPQIQLSRLMQRNHLDENEAKARIAAQIPLDEKIKQADFVIDNNENLIATYAQVDAMLAKIEQLQ